MALKMPACKFKDNSLGIKFQAGHPSHQFFQKRKSLHSLGMRQACRLCPAYAIVGYSHPTAASVGSQSVAKAGKRGRLIVNSSHCLVSCQSANLFFCKSIVELLLGHSEVFAPVHDFSNAFVGYQHPMLAQPSST